MTNFQRFALAHPLARAKGSDSQTFRHITMPWSIILTVNK